MSWFKYILFIVGLFVGCFNGNQHIQTAGLFEAVNEYKTVINSHSDSVDSLIPYAARQQSLIYSRDNYSFHVNRYVTDSKVNLYVETGIRSDNDYFEKKYYLKDGKLVLFVQKQLNLDESHPGSIQRTFFKSGKVVATEGKVGDGVNELNLFSYHAIRSITEIEQDLLKLKDAVYQKGNFDLIFDEIAAYPKARYMILSRNGVNPYRSALLIEEQDNFMKMVLSNPGKYKGRKVKINWKIREPFEAVYVSGALD